MKKILTLVLGCVMGAMAWGQEMCRIQGVNGSCGIAPFYGAQSLTDPIKTCDSLRNVRYFYGQCKSNRLDGLVALTLAPQRLGSDRVQSALLLKVTEGVPAPYGLQYEDWGISAIRMPDGRAYSLGGCIKWSGSKTWDERESYEPCRGARSVFGIDALQKTFGLEMLNQTADLKMLSTRLQKGSSEQQANSEPLPFTNIKRAR